LIDDEAIRAGTPTVDFVSDVRVAGNGGCNLYVGQMHVSGHAMRFININRHFTGCEPQIVEQEGRFMSALTAVRRFRVESGRLVLLDGANKQRLLLEQSLRQLGSRGAPRQVGIVAAPAVAASGDAAAYASSNDANGSSMSWPGARNYRVADLELVTVTATLGEYFGAERGALVVRAPVDNLFELREGDVIVSVNGRQPATGAHALRILGSCQPREAVHLDVIRQHKSTRIDVTLPP
jgi:hypothetical protein